MTDLFSSACKHLLRTRRTTKIFAGQKNSRGGAEPPAEASLEEEDVRPRLQQHGVRDGGPLVAVLVVGSSAQLPATYGAPELGKGWEGKGGGGGSKHEKERKVRGGELWRRASVTDRCCPTKMKGWGGNGSLVAPRVGVCGHGVPACTQADLGGVASPGKTRSQATLGYMLHSCHTLRCEKTKAQIYLYPVSTPIVGNNWTELRLFALAASKNESVSPRCPVPKPICWHSTHSNIKNEPPTTRKLPTSPPPTTHSNNSHRQSRTALPRAGAAGLQGTPESTNRQLTPWVSLCRLSLREDAARTMAGRVSTPWAGDAACDAPPPPPPPPWRLEFSEVRPPVRPWRLELRVIYICVEGMGSDVWERVCTKYLFVCFQGARHSLRVAKGTVGRKQRATSSSLKTVSCLISIGGGTGQFYA